MASRKPQRISFQGGVGATLAGRLDLPIDAPIAYALFAHCFTCSKDIFAARRISEQLTQRGFGVLRFDFTGLGHSEGDFANTNFSSNVSDLVAAADHLRREFEAPTLLIGHSLGGAAVIAAAAEITEVKAVATIGAPATADHVVQNFAADLDRIEADGQGDVTLGGRPFTIQKQFVDDLRAQSVSDRVAEMRKPLLILHAPLDEVVGIDNATAIFSAARHPKSFVSLDTADHLLSKKEDAIFTADVIAAWANRYATPQASKVNGEPESEVKVSETGHGKFQQIARVGAHRLIADEPADYGGMDSGPTPYGLLSAALGACTTMTMRLYADRKGWPVDKLTARITHNKIHAEDCEDCDESVTGRIDEFKREIEIEGDLDAQQRQKLMEIADKCPVHRTFKSPVSIPTQLGDS
jgi:putative redox protein